MAFEWPLRVYIEDTDFGGLVYYANHLKFMERARTECLREAGWSQAGLIESGLLFVVGRVDVKFRAPARLDQELCVRTGIQQVKGARLTFEQAIVDVQSSTLLSSGTVEVICVEPGSMKPRRWPTELIESVRVHVPQAWIEQE